MFGFLLPILKIAGTQALASLAKGAVEQLASKAGKEGAELIKDVALLGAEKLVEHSDTSFDDEALEVIKEELRPVKEDTRKDRSRRKRRRHSDR